MATTDDKIAKFWAKGCSIERIAEKIGRPADLERVVQGINRLIAEGRIHQRCSKA